MSKVVIRELLVLGAALLLSTGCGIFSKKGSSPTAGTPGYTGGTGSLVFHVIWPERGAKSRVIPPETVRIDIEITGEGLAIARKETIERPATTKRIDNLPIGQKGVTAIAKDGAGKSLAIGFASVIVEPNIVKDVMIELRPIEQSQIALARAMVQDVRDAGVALGGGVGQEIANQVMVLSADIIPVYALTLQRLDFLNTVLTAVYLEDEEDGPYALWEIDHGTYEAKLELWGYWGWVERWRVVLKRIGEPDATWPWIVQFPAEDALTKDIVLRFKYQTGQGWEFSATSQTEPHLKYEGKLTLVHDDQDRLTKATVTGTFKDKFLPDGITVQATLEGKPFGQKSYTQLSFTGNITSPKVSLSVDSAVANFQPPAQDEKYWGSYFTSAELKNLKFKTQNVAEPIEIMGNLSVEADITQASPDKGPLIKKGNFTGKYTSNYKTFDGSISFDWKNPHRKRLQETPIGTATIEGRWVMINRPIFSAQFKLTATEPGKFKLEIDLTRGTHYLRGGIDEGKWEIVNGDLKVTDWLVSLKNENNIELRFRKHIKGGEIFGSDGNKVADIQKDPDLKIWVVKYVDDTVESLQPINIGYEPPLLTGTVRGRVVDKVTQQPVEQAEVWSGWDLTWTDRDGFFQVEALAGEQTIHVRHWDYEGAEVQVDVPARGTVDVGTIELVP